MAGETLKGDQSGNILVEFDYNNIILVDPNKVKDSQGRISERLVDHENMVMYANLEAELLPRTKLAVGASPDSIRTISIAKINFLKPNNDEYLTTNYYDELTGENTVQGRGTNQSRKTYVPPSNGSKGYNRMDTTTGGEDKSIDTGLLGITSINVKISGSFIPTVNIELEDVQGRALFQLGENSPYAAFFHLPYPPFYLTLKGYYGQAVKYQLNLTKFNARFNSMGGNYQVSLEFQGYKYNILNEISMGYILATPHMYSSRFDISNSPTSPNTDSSLQKTSSQQGSSVTSASNSQNATVKQLYVEKGYQKILEVYNEYKAKNLISKDFPELTLQQLMNKLQMFEQTIIEDYQNGKSDVQPLTDIRNYQTNLKLVYEVIYSAPDSFFAQYINPKPFIGIDGTYYYAYKQEVEDSKQDEIFTKMSGKIKEYNDVLDSNPTLGKGAKDPIINKITPTILTATTTPDKIDWEKTTTEQTGIVSPTVIQVQELINSYDKLFQPKVVGSVGTVANSVFGPSAPGEKFSTKVNKTPSIEIVKPYFFVIEGQNRFKNVVQEMNAIANKRLSDVETKLSEELKQKIEDKKTGLGFSPTVRNIVAVILASAEGFIRLMDDVHSKAWNVKYDPVRKAAILNNSSSAPGVDTKNVVNNTITNSANSTVLNTPVYPWPHFFVEEIADDKKGRFQLKYPGDPSVVQLTQAYNYEKWPEVEFVEEFINGATKKFDTPATQDPSDVEQYSPLLNINAIEYPQSDVIYANKQEIKYFYEIWERQFLTSRYENYARFTKDNTSDFENLVDLITEVDSKNILTTLGTSNPSLNLKLKEYKFDSQNYVAVLKAFSKDGTSDSWKKFIKDEFVTPYIESITQSPNQLLTTDNLGKESTSNVDIKKLENIIKSTITNTPKIIDTYPFTNTRWTTSNLVDSSTIDTVYNTTKTLKINETTKLISNYTNLNEFETNRPVTNFSYTDVQNPLNNSNAFAPQSSSSFIKTLYYNRTPDQFIPTEGFCYFSTPKNQNSTISGLLTPNLPIKTTTSILNTPFFINAIQEGVANEKIGNDNSYTSAAYLFINSLPLISLREKLKNKGSKLSDLDYMFATIKKFAAIHKIPYAWILKMGSIWHRYKIFISEGRDIISNNIWTNANYKFNFDPISSNPQKKYTLTVNGKTGTTIQLESFNQNITTVQTGFYPKLIDDFNFFYKGSVLYNTFSDEEIQDSLDSGMKLYNFTPSNLTLTEINPPSVLATPVNFFTWSVMLPNNNSYYFVPSWGGNQNQVIDSMVENNSLVSGSKLIGNNSVYNGSTRLLWSSPNYGYFDASQIKKPNYDSYVNNIVGSSDNLSPFELLNTDSYSKIEEIFSVFDKSTLDLFETEFINFSKPVTKIKVPGNSQSVLFREPTNQNLNFTNFQLLFRNLMSMRPKNSNETEEQFFNVSINEQLTNFTNIIEEFLKYDVILKLGNPSYYNRFIFDSFLKHVSASTVTDLATPEIFGPYIQNTLPSRNGTVSYNLSFNQNPNTWKELYLNVGFSEIIGMKYSDNGSYITDFFIDNNIEFNVDNVKKLAPIIKIYATQKIENANITSASFTNSLLKYFGDCDSLQNITLDRILGTIRKNLPNYSETPEKTINSRVDGQQTKADAWENFKSLNDKWIAGGDFTSKTFLEDILFLDKASRNVGETLYLDIFSLRNILNERSQFENMTVYAFISNLLIENKFVVMNLPAYVNFYNVQDVDGLNNRVPQQSLEFADSMWGTYLTVDYRKSGPKMVCFFVGKPSSYLDLEESKNFLFRSDGIQIDKSNPLIENQTNKKDWALSNRCVGFSVDIGIRNQNIFYSFQVSQDSGKGTMESVSTLYNMINQASGRQTSTQNVSLFNYYSNRSYGCQVVGLGNALIQPTMYFNLRHVPMFNGPYLITEVNHVITPGQFQTSFNGTRQGIYDVPSLDSYLQSINQNLLTKLEELVVTKDKQNMGSNSSGLQNNSKDIIQSSDNKKDTTNSCTPDTSYSTYEVTGATETDINLTDLADSIKKTGVGTELALTIFTLCYLRTYKQNLFYGFDNNFALVTADNKYQTTLSSSSSFTYKTYSCISSQAIGGEKSLPILNFKSLDLFIGFMKARLESNLAKIQNVGLYQYYLCDWQDNPVTVDNFNTNKTTTYKKTDDDINAAMDVAKSVGFKLDSKEKYNKFIYGRDYTPTPTPTPSQVVNPTPQNVTNVLNITRERQGQNEIKIKFKIESNVGNWKITDIKFELPSNSPVGIKDGTVMNGSNIVNWFVSPFQMANEYNTPGIYNFTYQVTVIPTTSNGAPDTTNTRSTRYERISSVVTITPTNPTVTTSVTINYLGEFSTTQGNDSSYYNIQQNNGNFKVLRIVDSNFNFNNVGIVQFKDSSGAVTPYSCSAGSGSNTCTVNGRNAGTYTMNAQYYPNGPLNSSAINLVSPSFTQ